MREPRSRVLPRWVARLARLQPWHLLTRFPNRWTRAGFAFVNGGVAIGILAGAAAFTDQPLIFPSLGPSAFLFFYQPSAPSSAPRNAILAHASALLIGWAAWELSGITGGGVGIATVAVALGLTCAAMIAFGVPHPPAASTALMVTLGAVRGWQEIAAMLVGVVLLTLQALVFNRLAGISYPLWKPQERRAPGDFLVSALQISTPAPPGDPYAPLADRLTKRSPLQPQAASKSPLQPQTAARSPFHPRSPEKKEEVRSP